MKSLLRRRPSPALVVSLIALFVSLSGVSYGVATGFIDSREIKNNEVRSIDLRNNDIRTRDLRNNEVRGLDIRNSTIQSRDIGLNQVTGDDVREDTLQKVPSAAAADTATSATSAGSATTAGSVGGLALKKFAYTAEADDSFRRVLDFGGLVLEAQCEAPGAVALRANAAAGVQNAELRASGELTASNSDFDSGDNTLIGIADPSGDASGVITFVRPGGAVVTVQALALSEPNDLLGTSNDCGFFGTAIAG
ncbi:MAG TPA: hypothetical protein VK307_03865 [Thermoleophilaceae bacterium]|nr:hypothetical protein [Thermoleophilaceae bacterium]